MESSKEKLDAIESVFRWAQQYGVTEAHVSIGDLNVQITRGAVASAVPAAAAADDSAQPGTPSPSVAPVHRHHEGMIVITAPIVGLFYHAPTPGAKAYTQVGEHVTAGQVVGIVETMKVMNEVLTEHAGVVAEISAQNGAEVEFGQPLILLREQERRRTGNRRTDS